MKKPDGLKCPDCGCRDLITPNVIRIPGAIRRYRVCRNCGKHVRTREVIEGPKNEKHIKKNIEDAAGDNDSSEA